MAKNKRANIDALKASYVSAITWGGAVLSSEIQLTGNIARAFLLAERLVRDVVVVRCLLFTSLDEGKKGELVMDKGKYSLEKLDCQINLGGDKDAP